MLNERKMWHSLRKNMPNSHENREQKGVYLESSTEGMREEAFYQDSYSDSCCRWRQNKPENRNEPEDYNKLPELV